MNHYSTLRDFAMKLPGTTEEVQWEDHLLIKVGSKMFVMFSLAEDTDQLMNVKCIPERAAELIEMEGVDPAPYLAKHNWIRITQEARLSIKELKELIEQSYQLVFAKLPKKARLVISKG